MPDYTHGSHHLRNGDHRHTAERFGLRYEEIPGSNTLIKKILHGPRDGEFVAACPGGTTS
jgi:hypothetical protein